MHPHRKTQYRNMQTNELDPVLHYISKHIYEDRNRSFQKDRRNLLYALTWPAAWLDSQARRMHSQDYQRMLMDKPEQIHAHVKALTGETAKRSVQTIKLSKPPILFRVCFECKCATNTTA